jgi:hypothetical protein
MSTFSEQIRHKVAEAKFLDEKWNQIRETTPFKSPTTIRTTTGQIETFVLGKDETGILEAELTYWPMTNSFQARVGCALLKRIENSAVSKDPAALLLEAIEKVKNPPEEPEEVERDGFGNVIEHPPAPTAEEVLAGMQAQIDAVRRFLAS